MSLNNLNHLRLKKKKREPFEHPPVADRQCQSSKHGSLRRIFGKIFCTNTQLLYLPRQCKPCVSKTTSVLHKINFRSLRPYCASSRTSCSRAAINRMQTEQLTVMQLQGRPGDSHLRLTSTFQLFKKNKIIKNSFSLLNKPGWGGGRVSTTTSFVLT